MNSKPSIDSLISEGEKLKLRYLITEENDDGFITYFEDDPSFFASGVTAEESYKNFDYAELLSMRMYFIKQVDKALDDHDEYNFKVNSLALNNINERINHHHKN